MVVDFGTMVKVSPGLSKWRNIVSNL